MTKLCFQSAFQGPQQTSLEKRLADVGNPQVLGDLLPPWDVLFEMLSGLKAQGTSLNDPSPHVTQIRPTILSVVSDFTCIAFIWISLRDAKCVQVGLPFLIGSSCMQ